MMDWDGKVERVYDYQDGKPNIFLIDKKGNITFRLFDEASSYKLRQLNEKIDALLKNKLLTPSVFSYLILIHHESSQ